MSILTMARRCAQEIIVSIGGVAYAGAMLAGLCRRRAAEQAAEQISGAAGAVGSWLEQLRGGAS